MTANLLPADHRRQRFLRPDRFRGCPLILSGLFRNPVQTLRCLSLPWIVSGLACLFIAGPVRSHEQPQMKEIAPGIFQLGPLKLDKKSHTLTFPAEVNMRDSLIEYLLVHKTGKTHESLLATDVEPSDLHLAMLLLGVKDSAAAASPPPTQIDSAYLKSAPKLGGDPVDIQIIWKDGEKEKQCRAEEWITNTAKKAAMQNGPWLYNGSYVVEGKFAAQTDGSIVAVVTDPSALMNNPRPDDTNDMVWAVRAAKVPPVGTPVVVSFTLRSGK